MRIGWRRTRLVAGATIAWVIGIAWATGGDGMSTRAAATAGVGHLNSKTERRAFQPACASRTAFQQAGAPAASQQRPQMSDEAFKNVQVLKGIPVDEFMGTMGIFSAALGMCVNAVLHAGHRSAGRFVDGDVAVPQIIGVDSVAGVRGNVGGVVDDDIAFKVEIWRRSRISKEPRGDTRG